MLIFPCSNSNKWRISLINFIPYIITFILSLQLITLTASQISPMVSGRLPYQNQQHFPTQPSYDEQQDKAIRTNKARDITQYINFEADPCKDFFDYACGNWAQIQQPQHNGEILTPISRLELRINKDLQSMLSKSNEQINPIVRIVQNFYQSCLNVEEKSNQQVSFMRDFMKQFGGIPSLPNTNWQPNYDWLGVIAELRVQYGLNILISFEIDKNLDGMNGNSIFFSEPKTTIIPTENCSEEAMSNRNIRDEYFDMLTNEIAENIQNWINVGEAIAKRYAAEILKFEFDLCSSMQVEQYIQPIDENHNEESMNYPRGSPMYNRGQNRLYGKRPGYTLNQLNSYEGAIDFRRYVNIILKAPYNEKVHLRDESYLRHLARLVRGTQKTTIANYIMYRALSAINFPKDNRVSQRAMYCVQLVQKLFPKQTGEMCRSKYQHMDNLKSVNLYFNDITKALDDSFEAPWMTENTKRAARQKLAEFRVKFPIYQNLESELDPHIEQKNYWQKLKTIMEFNAKMDLDRLSTVDPRERPDTIEACDVRAKLMALDKEILISWALVQQPIFHINYPRAMNYAFLGQQIARELVMGFDEQGWRPVALNTRQWDEFTTQSYHNQTECFRTQYSNYLYNNPERFRNSSRLREIIADNSGLNLAFAAYIKWLQSEMPDSHGPLSRETLPDTNFTNTQLFFINFAQNRCFTKFGEQTPLEFFPLDKHTPERYNVNGPLANNPEFAREFGCTMGDEMHTADKCVLF